MPQGLDATHNPEFTTLEFYWAHTSMEQLRRTTQELLQCAFDLRLFCLCLLDADGEGTQQLPRQTSLSE